MMPAQSRVDAGIWSVPGLVPVIEYSRQVLNEILVKVVDAFDTYLAGGYEVGGVLFGNHQRGVVRVLAFRPFEITPPRPSFVLSESDGKRLDQMIRSARTDPELAEMEPVGWYHSHTRSEIFLSEGDVEIYDRHFPEPWQIAMVLHPSDLEPVRVGFFFREPDGFIRTDQSYQEFAVDAPLVARLDRPLPPWEITSDGEVKEPELTIENVSPDSYALPPEPGAPKLWGPVTKWLVALGAATVIAAGVASIVLLREAEPGMGLRLTPVEGELVIEWDPKSPGLQETAEGTLFVVDGPHRTDVPASKVGASARYVYRPHTGRVDVRLRMKLPWGRTRQEIATYLAHPDIGKPSPELLAEQKKTADAAREVEELRSQLLASKLQSEKLEVRTADLERAQQRLAELRRQPDRPAKSIVLPAIPPKSTVARDLPNGPEIAQRGGGPAAPPVGNTGSDPRMRPPAEVIKPPVQTAPSPTTPQGLVAAGTVRPAVTTVMAPTRPSYAGPVSGRIIWTGELPRNGVLTIEGRKPSRGAVNAELPGVPVRIAAFPAELSNDGLKVMTANPRLGDGKVEAPGAANGYTKTQYVFDAKSVRDLIVEQMPSSPDSKRMVLRAGGRRLSAIVIEWQVISQ